MSKKYSLNELVKKKILTIDEAIDLEIPLTEKFMTADDLYENKLIDLDKYLELKNGKFKQKVSSIEDETLIKELKSLCKKQEKLKSKNPTLKKLKTLCDKLDEKKAPLKKKIKGYVESQEIKRARKEQEEREKYEKLMKQKKTIPPIPKSKPPPIPKSKPPPIPTSKPPPIPKSKPAPYEKKLTEAEQLSKLSKKDLETLFDDEPEKEPKPEPKKKPEPEPEKKPEPEPEPEKKPEPEPKKINNNIRNEEELKAFYDKYNDFKTARQQANIKKILEKITTTNNYKDLIDLLVSNKRYNDFFPTPQNCLDSQIATDEIKRAEHIYEGTAGLGSLIFKAYKINPNVKISANELLTENVDFIKHNFPNCKITNENYLNLNVKNNDYDLHLLNPPFTNQGDKRFYLNFLFKAFEFIDNYKYNDMPHIIFFSPQLTEKKNRDEEVGDLIDLYSLRGISNNKKLELFNQYTGENKNKLNVNDWDDLLDKIEISQIQVIDTCKFQTTGIKVNVYLIIGTRNLSNPKRP